MTNITTSFPRVLDATMLSVWRTCPHKWFRAHGQGLVRPRPNVHLHFGATLAKGLEAARREFYASHDCSDALHVGCEAIIGKWGDFEPPAAPTRSEANKTLANCLASLQAYFHEWPLDEDPFQIHTHEGLPCIEWSGARPIPGSRHPETGEPILYAGRFDMIGDYSHSVMGLDDKTTSTDPDSDGWRNQWKLRSQFTGYVWLAAGYDLFLKGFMVRGIAPLKTDIKTGWALAPRPPWMVEAWLRQLQQDVNVMSMQHSLWKACNRDHPGMMQPHPFSQRFDDACADFGGCTFLDLCSSEHPDDWLDEYEVRRWDPLGRAA